LAEGSEVAGVFTQNAFCAAPVQLCKQFLPGEIRYLLINSGNANACTGDQGLADALASCTQVAELGGVGAGQVLPFSTGVIGESLPMDKFAAAIPKLFPALADDNWNGAARAIMTTDTRPKGASEIIEHDGRTIAISGIAKGSGMIKPNMATMLAYVATDAKLPQAMLQALAKECVDGSFNRITIDGDTSTNDSSILVATGASGAVIESEQDPLYPLLRDALKRVHIQLAQSIVGDGEGATKFVTVDVRGGAEQSECVSVAYSVAQSPLVKTALFASDPNWGRIVAAIGYAGVEGLDDRAVTVHLNDVLIVENGGCAASYTEADGQREMDKDEILILIELGRGDAAAKVWTTDLSHDYVTINADYRS
ncbi:MAG: bifunctional glutamate N-acetyltransferase/amino-acid acetyltransferase ArgJ, partial [Cellvibrionaceae bacterium]|nr:bifunctional glutamate N-acetyltransferase/amino-acid acetyltransferase ArgJ [Cellvibrionaceae bacterium]